MIPYLIAGAIGFVVAKLFEEDEAPKYDDGGFIKIKSFKSNEGEFDVYDVDENHKNRADMFVVFKDKKGWVVRNVIVPKEYQRKGIATKFYINMNEMSLKNTGKPLHSTQTRKLSNGQIVHELSEDGIAFWDSLVRDGIAKKISEKNYVFIHNEFSNGGLIAPNGKPSNLTPEQYKLVRLPEFKAWFGDWENDPANASKVIDENGEPLMVFHATNNDFNVFDEKYIGSSNDRGFYGKGFYFTFQSEFKDMKYAINEANYYGGKLLNCYIKAFNPFDLSNLKMYKNKKISYIGANSLVFLYNIAVLFPQIADKIFLEKNIYNKFSKEYDVEEVPISILPNLISKYANDLKYIETKTQQDIKETMGYVKSEIVKYDYTESGGTKGEFTSYDELGRVPYDISKEEKEILFIEIAIEKYDGISIRLQPEGYMTRNSIITDAIKEKHDCILQSKYGDELVVFQPNQIKLADGSNTTFDANNDDIRFDDGGSVLLAPNGKPSNLTPEQYKFVREPAFKKWFGDWENESSCQPYVYSQLEVKPKNMLLDKNSEPQVFYHGSDDFGFTIVNVHGSSEQSLFWITTSKEMAEGFTGSKKFGYKNEQEYFEKEGMVGGVYSFFVKTNKIFDIFNYNQVEEVSQKLADLIKLNKKYIYNGREIGARDLYSDWNKRDYFIAWWSSKDWNEVESWENDMWIIGMLKELGYDCITNKEGGVINIGFIGNPNQIKLADEMKDELGKVNEKTNTTFDGSNADIRFMAGGDTKLNVDRYREIEKEMFELRKQGKGDTLEYFKLIKERSIL